MKCSKCGAENAEEFKFCGTCGTPLTIPVHQTRGKDEIEDEVARLRAPSQDLRYRLTRNVKDLPAKDGKFLIARMLRHS